MERIDYFRDRCTNHYLYSKHAKKLSEAEFDECVDFIEEHDQLSHLQFEYAVNRYKLDQVKPKNHAIMLELLLVANCAKLGG